MSTEIQGLVETSNNPGVLKDDGGSYVLTCATRSSSGQARDAVLAQLRAIGDLAGATVVHFDGYQGWQPKLGTPLLRSVEQVYRQLFDDEPVFQAIHAGLECGLFMGQYPDLQVVSFGAEVKEGHSPNEWVSIPSVAKLWQFARALVADLATWKA